MFRKIYTTGSVPFDKCGRETGWTRQGRVWISEKSRGSFVRGIPDVRE